MAGRRKQRTLFDEFYEVFLRVPVWICLPVAFGAFVLIQAFVSAASGNPILRALAPLGTLFSVVVPFLILAAGFAAATAKSRRRQVYDEQTGIESIRALSWREFEMLIGEAYRRLGYEVTETGGGGADGGIDLVLCRSGERVLVQCKQWKVYKVGVRAVRELYGVLTAEGAARAIFVTSGVYTHEAVSFARGKPLELIDGEQLCRLIDPVRRNSPAPGGVSENASTECPVCGQPMVLRTAKKGVHAGSRFWGCSAYPRCRGVRQCSESTAVTAASAAADLRSRSRFRR